MAPKGTLKKCSACGVSKPRDGFSQWAFYASTRERKCKACMATATEASGGSQTGRPSTGTLRALALQQSTPSTGISFTSSFSPAAVDPLRPSASTKRSGRTVPFDSPSSEDDQPTKRLSFGGAGTGPPTTTKERAQSLNDTHRISYLVPSLGEDGFLDEDGGWEGAVIVAVPVNTAAGSQ